MKDQQFVVAGLAPALHKTILCEKATARVAPYKAINYNKICILAQPSV